MLIFIYYIVVILIHLIYHNLMILYKLILKYFIFTVRVRTL